MTRRTWRDVRSDLTAGAVLGVESVPDGLASGVLAGVNPVAGLNAYLFGMLGAAAFTSTTLMAVQSTGAMALVVNDVQLSAMKDPNRALFTLSVLTGVVMIISALVRADRLMRYVNTAVMTGFVAAVGVNIVLGQLSNATGYEAQGRNRIAKTFSLLLHFTQVNAPTLAITVVTMVLILVLERTRLGPFGLVLAVVIASFLPPLMGGAHIALVRDIAKIPSSLPAPVLPDPSLTADLIVAAISLSFIGLVQGAGVAAGISNPDGHRTNLQRDFIGQGMGNVAAGVFQGMPVGGSMSASALLRDGKAKTRLSLVAASVTMALVILLAAHWVALIAMPALAGLLILVGARSVKPSQLRAVAQSGNLAFVVMVITFVLTLVAPLQYAVLLGVALSIVARVAKQANHLELRRLQIFRDGRWRETEPPDRLVGHTVVALQPFGSLFFASAPVLEDELPKADEASAGAVVILRLRGIETLGLAVIEVLKRYADTLRSHGATLKVVLPADPAVWGQAKAEGLPEALGAENTYRGSEWVGTALRKAWDDAEAMAGPQDPGDVTVTEVHVLAKKTAPDLPETPDLPEKSDGDAKVSSQGDSGTDTRKRPDPKESRD